MGDDRTIADPTTAALAALRDERDQLRAENDRLSELVAAYTEVEGLKADQARRDQPVAVFVDEAVQLAKRVAGSTTAPYVDALARAVLALHEENERLRGAPALTDEELAAIIDAQGCMRGHCNRNDKWHVAAIAGLSKLTSRARGAANDAVTSAESRTAEAIAAWLEDGGTAICKSAAERIREGAWRKP